jgi:ATP-dependent helicase/nuclease subunit A
MTQLSFDESARPSQLSLGGLATSRMGLNGVDATTLDPTTRTLTAEQELAVERRKEPLLLAAGAGSGKTSVLVERFVRAVREDRVAPGRILAITFTERAAGELRERVRGRFGELGEREAARDTEAAFVSTFHGFCARLLRVHPLAAGLDPEFTILDEGLAARLRGRAWAGALGAFLEGERGDAVDLLAAWGADRVRAMVAGTYAELRSRGEPVPKLPALVFQPTLPSPVLQRPTVSEPALSEEDEPSGDGHSEHGCTHAEELPTGNPGEVDAEGARACALLGELLELFGHEYAALKTRRGALDFDDLELGACTLLEEHESVRRAWAERFELIMVDEFQDTNPRQLAILGALERGNLFTVGDELQSIYGFRHADVSLFRARRDELAERGGSLSLTRNFRGRKPLLDVVNVVFGERFGDRHTPLEAGRADRATHAGDRPRRSHASADGAGSREDARAEEEEQEPIVELLLTHKLGWEENEDLAASIAGELPSAPRWRQAEARLLARRVAELVQSGAAQAGDVAVLLRAVGDLELYERALQDRGLNTLATVGGFWGGQQVGDLLAYLRALANPLDELALYGTLASPLFGVSSDGLALLGRAAKASKRGVWETVLLLVGEDLPAVCLPPEADRPPGEPQSRRSGSSPSADRSALRLLPPADRDLLVEFCMRFQTERAAGRRTLSQLIERALDRSGYVEHVLSLSWPERRLANVHKLLRLARSYEASEGRDLRGFLDHVAHHQDGRSGAEPDAPVADGEADAVRLMSIHAAKGLEFGVVCVADLGRAQNLSVPDLLVDGDRVGLRLARLDGSEGTPSLAWNELCEERRLAQAEEEDRILYVAMTRARERLLLSGAVDLERWPEPRLGAPAISWLGPALSAELPASVQQLHPPVRELAVAVGGSDGTRIRVGLTLNAPETVGTVLPGVGGHPSAGGGDLSPTPVNEAKTTGEKEDRQSPLPPALPSPSQTAGAPADPGGHPRAPGRHLAAPPGNPVRPDTLSYTTLTELERCSYRFYLERVVGLPERRAPARAEEAEQPRKDALDARVRGTILHRLLESLDDFLPGAAPAAQDVANVARELGARVAREEREQLAELLRAALDTPLAARLAAAAPGVRREHPFAFSLAPTGPLPTGVLLTGVLDVLAREPSGDGGALVVDYKSDRIAPDEDLEAVVEREYSIQRLLYALAVLADGAPRVEIVHWFLQRPAEPIGAVFTAEDRPRLEDALARIVEDARTRPFTVSQNPHRGLCLTCPGRSGLCSWSDSVTLRERVGP